LEVVEPIASSCSNGNCGVVGRGRIRR
jgi:hypothetical protein